MTDETNWATERPFVIMKRDPSPLRRIAPNSHSIYGR